MSDERAVLLLEKSNGSKGQGRGSLWLLSVPTGLGRSHHLFEFVQADALKRLAFKRANRWWNQAE